MKDSQFAGFGKGGEKVRNRLLLISLTVILVLSVGFIGCGSEGLPEVTKHTLTTSSTEGGLCIPALDPISGEGTEYSEGTEVPIEAQPAPGYRFICWTGDVDTIADVNAAKTTIIMNDDYSITANFVKQYDLTISSTSGGSVTTPGEGTHTYDKGKVVNLVAQAEGGYHFVNWTGDVGTIANANATITSITMSSNYSITANFAVDLYFSVDAYLNLSGPATSPPEERNPCLVLGTVTNIVMNSVRVDLPDGRFIIVPRYGDVFGPGVNQTTVLRFATCVPGIPIAGGEYIFTGLDMAGEPIPEATNIDSWVGVEPPDPPTNVRAELTEDGILVSWDESATIPGSFEPAAVPQLGSYQLQISRIETGEYIYGAATISASSHLVPRDKADFTGKDCGLSLSEMEDGVYSLDALLHSIAPEGSLGKGNEYCNGDPGESIIFTIQDGRITIL
jgi:hypothetical protein